MRANEFGVTGPKVNTTKIMSLRDVAIGRRLLTTDVLEIDSTPIINVTRQEAVILERIAVDYCIRNLVRNSEVCSMGISKHSREMTTRPLVDLVKTSAWLGHFFFAFLSGVDDDDILFDTSKHSEEDLFEVIIKDPLMDNWDGWFGWKNSNLDVEYLYRIEFTRIWTQRTFNTEYTRDGIKYNSGWKDSEWEESFCDDDT